MLRPQRMLCTRFAMWFLVCVNTCYAQAVWCKNLVCKSFVMYRKHNCVKGVSCEKLLCKHSCINCLTCKNVLRTLIFVSKFHCVETSLHVEIVNHLLQDFGALGLCFLNDEEREENRRGEQERRGEENRRGEEKKQRRQNTRSTRTR